MPHPTPAAEAADTFPRLLQYLAATRGEDTALQEKRYGIWVPVTFQAYASRVRDFAHGLASLGVRRGELVAVLGDNRPEWLIAELASQSIGAVVVGIYPTSIGEELLHILTLGRVRVVVAEDQEQVDKLVRLVQERDNAPAHDGSLLVEKVVYYDPHGLEEYDEPYLEHFVDLEAHGRAWGEQHPGWFEEQVDAGNTQDVAVICTTSGTTSRPKLAELTHANLIAMARHLMAIDPIGHQDRYVSFLPFAWIGEQMLAVACGLTRGFTISFPESSSTQRHDLREIGPDVMFSPPRIWESMLSEVQVRIDEAGRLKRAVFGWGFGIGERVAERRIQGKPVGALRLLYLVADQVALRPVRDQLGLARLDRGYTGGAPLGPDVFRFFHSIGVNLKQIYGQTEICGLAVVHRDDDISFNTVGTPLPETDIAIAEDGEILLRSASVLRGYHRNPEASAAAVDADGWLHTGDAGYLDQHGHLVVIDRKKDVLSTADGTKYSSAFIENKLKFSPYVEEAVALPTDDVMTAIITIDPMTTGSWAEGERLTYTTYADLAGKSEVQELLAEEVHRANEDLPEAIRVRRFLLLHKQFDPDDDEVTRTRKVRRNVIAERYADLITALAEGRDEVTVHTTVTYQDGSKVDRSTTLGIYSMDGYHEPEGRSRRPVWSGRR